MKRGMVSLLAIALLLATSSLALAGGSASRVQSKATSNGHGPFRAQVVYRVGPPTPDVLIDIAASAHDERSFWWLVELQKRGHRWVYPDRQGTLVAGGGLSTTAYGTPIGRTPPCPVCAYPVGMSEPGHEKFRSDPSSVFYVVSQDMDIVVTPKTPGWRVKEAPAPNVHRVFGEDASATGVRSEGRSVEHFTSASVVGGKYGSAAFATLPCQYGGVGSALFSGGLASHKLGCGSPSGGDADWDTGIELPTTWRLKGDATGAGIWPDRLLVFDFPRP